MQGKLTNWNWMVDYSKGLTLGYKTDIEAFTYINARHGVVIEDFVQIGSHCSIYSISTIDNKEGPVRLINSCRIDNHSVIMLGVTIGENSILGAFSFLNRDVPDNVIALGTPVRIIKKIKAKR
jgi:acetyltransferase-like isoleucine patch superfamily enzyme